MMVIFVSQCEKNALKKTRRVLDAFADRIGDNTWQTVITEDGLITVKKMLRQTATKSTAVSCHWIRSRSRSQLLWVVGNRRKFNSEGVVAVNSTKRKIQGDESNWQYLPLIRALTALAALLHDWGKATKLFQKKLKATNTAKCGDPIRHEWISCVLLDAFIRYNQREGKQWLIELANGNIDSSKLKSAIIIEPQKLVVEHDHTAQLLLWLIVSHHRLPLPKNDAKDTYKDCKEISTTTMATVLKQVAQNWGYENRKDEALYQQRVQQCFEFPEGFLQQSKLWLKDVKRWANKLSELQPMIEQVIDNQVVRLVLHHARLSLMLGDHHYSSQDKDDKWVSEIPLFANTDRKTKNLKQKLDEHLVGVKKSALEVINLLPTLEKMPDDELTAVFDNVELKKASKGNFTWQQKTIGEITKFKNAHENLSAGAFVVNMASTGCGKTFANAKIMQALSKSGNSLRFILALGLRTLTLQTGDEYRDRIGLTKSELAVLIGSKAVKELHDFGKQKADDEITDYENAGSESLESLLEQDISYDGLLPEDGLSTVLTDLRTRQFLYAPVLACTIDHIMSATETQRGGRYILPCLRLLSSDLVIDEVDDFTGEDLAAIARLVHLAGMLGRKVMISSATIPPALAEGFFHAYRKGWALFSLSQIQAPDVVCIWVDEFKCVCQLVSSSEQGVEAYSKLHQQFVKDRLSKLGKQSVKRKAKIIDCPLNLKAAESNQDKSAEKNKLAQYANIILDAAVALHDHHNTCDEITQKRVSFGVVRTANIAFCVELTKYLLDCEIAEDIEIRVMAYHSQQILLMRHEQEYHLDHILKRKEEPQQPPNAFSDPTIRNHLKSSQAKNVLFIVIATPVEEVGRDHDFDWAIVEPSSYRSIIQLAGRVRRHREGGVVHPNIALLQYNWKAFKNNDAKGEMYFRDPGYEKELEQALPTHDLKRIVDEVALGKCVDASPRIQLTPSQSTSAYFAGMEHYTTKGLLAHDAQKRVSHLQGYLCENWWLTALPQQFQKFRRSESSTELFYVWDERKQTGYWAEKDEDGAPVNRESRYNIKSVELTDKQVERLWLKRNYQDLLAKWIAYYPDYSLKKLSLRLGELNLIIRDGTSGFEYNPQLGMYKGN